MNYFQKLFYSSAFILVFSVFVFTQIPSDKKFYGKFESELIPDTRQLFRLMLRPSSDSAKNNFEFPIEKNISLTKGVMIALHKSGGRFDVTLIESATAMPTICLDTNNNSKFNKTECSAMSVSKENPNDFEYILKVPIQSTRFKTFPIFLKYKKNFTVPQMSKGEKVLMQSLLGYAIGRVDLRKRSAVLVQYQFDPQEGTISTTDGIMGVDVDGDGLIKNEPFSYETSYAADDEIVFRFEDMYISTLSLDIAKNEIVMRERKAEEYKRIELEVGKIMPYFPFVDFDNKKGNLKDFRGKYVLIDFWGLWCVDCVREFPYQFKAYNDFRSRGFEILGMDTDEDSEKVKAVLKRSNIHWTQAKHESIKELVETSYRIQEYPSAILIDPNGKILVLEQSLLKGMQLLKTLDEILPK